jgi:hypothetical protein
MTPVECEGEGNECCRSGIPMPTAIYDKPAASPQNERPDSRIYTATFYTLLVLTKLAMQINPAELLSSRTDFQATKPGATKCVRHSSALLSFNSPSPYCWGSVAYDRTDPLCRRDRIHAPREMTRNDPMYYILQILQVEEPCRWMWRAFSPSAARWSKLGTDDHSRHVLLCYANCWSLLGPKSIVYSISSLLSHPLCCFYSVVLTCSFSPVSWGIPPVSFLCQVFDTVLFIHLYHPPGYQQTRDTTSRC